MLGLWKEVVDLCRSLWIRQLAIPDVEPDGLYLSLMAEGISWQSVFSARRRAVPVVWIRPRHGEGCSPKWIGLCYLLQSFT